MSFKKHLLKYLLVYKIIYIILGTLIMFYALYFSDKEASLKTIAYNINNPMMYVCLILSFIGAVFITKFILNKKNLK